MWGFGWLEPWRRTSPLTRIHQYTSWSLYLFCGVEGALILSVLVQVAGESALWALALAGAVAAAHVVVGVRVTVAGLRHYLGAGPRPDRLVRNYAALTLVGVGALTAALAAGGLPKAATVTVVYVSLYHCAPIILAWSFARGLRLVAVTLAATTGCLALLGANAWALVGMVVISVPVAVVLGALHRVSAWTLRVMDRLDAARETEARLAVAEERLRFGRDLHDVLGRNLSVIALKAELAVALARRGAAGAEASVAQMTEVQRIAWESQAEMREVVRGYRAADLHAELAGARGVLEAAGISCRIEDGAAAELPAAVQSALGWVVREGTTNVLRHADAARCVVRLRRHGPDRVVLDMENDGVRGTSGGGGGSGLAGLRERLAKLGGSLTAGGEADVFRLTAEIRLGSGV